MVNHPTDADMPSIESLNDKSDFKDFMSPNVSEALRKLALRKFFHGSPINICDGLDVYDSDYTSFAKLGDVVTADMAFHIERAAKEKLDAASKEKLEENSITHSDIEYETSNQEQNDAENTEASVAEFKMLDEARLEPLFEQPGLEVMAIAQTESVKNVGEVRNGFTSRVENKLDNKGKTQG